ncbi:hypothetical protein DERF_009389 [Dermatophagoides farinae]|uniref:Transmembrane protein n=1 Tax=Dermatophagoides farinae TaxID=6954 RepID=A0A922HX77_DERFA|nr:hypothetical protein DERF_009389 [Dermatophagoides farinae]
MERTPPTTLITNGVLSLLLIMLITLITIVFELSFWIVIVRFVTDDVDVVDSIGTSLFVVGDDGKITHHCNN